MANISRRDLSPREIDSYNFVARSNPLQLLKYRLAVAKVITGTADANVLCFGDSTTWGSQSASGADPVRSYPKRLADLINGTGIPAMHSLIIPPSALSGVTDNRFTTTTGWNKAQFAAGGNATYQAVSTTPLVVTPGVAADTYDVRYLKSAGSGSMDIQATGGSVVNVVATGASDYGVATVTASSASAANTVTITPTGTIYIVGIAPRLASTKQVLMHNAGVSSTTTANWITTAATGPIEFIKEIAPDLTIISLGINDATPGTVTKATYKANIQTMITAALLSGDVALLSMPPSSGANYVTFEPQYVEALYELGNENNVPVIDTFGRWNETYQATYMTDTLHPTNSGYADIAMGVFNKIGRV